MFRFETQGGGKIPTLCWKFHPWTSWLEFVFESLAESRGVMATPWGTINNVKCEMTLPTVHRPISCCWKLGIYLNPPERRRRDPLYWSVVWQFWFYVTGPVGQWWSLGARGYGGQEEFRPAQCAVFGRVRIVFVASSVAPWAASLGCCCRGSLRSSSRWSCRCSSP